MDKLLWLGLYPSIHPPPLLKTKVLDLFNFFYNAFLRHFKGNLLDFILTITLYFLEANRFVPEPE